MKEFSNPTIEIVSLEETDLITTSGGQEQYFKDNIDGDNDYFYDELFGGRD